MKTKTLFQIGIYLFPTAGFLASYGNHHFHWNLGWIVPLLFLFAALSWAGRVLFFPDQKKMWNVVDIILAIFCLYVAFFSAFF